MTGSQVQLLIPSPWRGVRKTLVRLAPRPRHTTLRGKR